MEHGLKEERSETGWKNDGKEQKKRKT